MEKKLTYRQAYDKIIQAYFKDEIKPMMGEFCFCGTLADGMAWRNPNGGLYTHDQYKKMEWALLHTINCSGGDNYRISTEGGTKQDEDALFTGMVAALEVLKSIHKERGENVDDVLVFTKRVLNEVEKVLINH